MTAPTPNGFRIFNGTAGTTGTDTGSSFTNFTPGQKLWLSYFYYANRVTGTTATVTITISINWYNSSGTLISTTTGQTISVAAGLASYIRTSEDLHTPPTGAVSGQSVITVTSSVNPFAHDVFVTAIRLAPSRLFSTSNTPYVSSTAPTNPTDGDYWLDTSSNPNVLKLRVNGAWQVSATNVTNTNQITDGAGLGTTATWTGVTGTGKPQDNATVGNNLLSDPTFTNTTTGSSGAIWLLGTGCTLDTGADTTSATGLNAVRSVKGPVGNGTTSQAADNTVSTSSANGGEGLVPVEAGRTYRATAMFLFKAGYTGLGKVTILYYSKAIGAALTSTFTNATDFRTVACAADTIQTVDVTLTAPTNAAYARILVTENWSTTLPNAGYMQVARPQILLMADTTMLTPGAVTPTKASPFDNENILPDPFFYDMSLWTLGPGCTLDKSAITTGAANLGVRQSVKTPSGNSATIIVAQIAPAPSQMAEAEANKTYNFSFKALYEAGYTGLIQMVHAYYNDAGTLLSSSVKNGTDFRTAAAAAQTVETVSWTTTAPAGTTKVRVYFNELRSTTLTNAGSAYIGNPRVYRLTAWDDGEVVGSRRPSDYAGTTVTGYTAIASTSTDVAADFAFQGNTWTRTLNGSRWDSLMISNEKFTDAVAAIWSGLFVGSSYPNGMAGLTDQDNPTITAGQSYYQLDYAFYTNATSILIYENGSSIGTFKTGATGTEVLCITYDGTQVRYWIDGVLKRTVTTTAGQSFRFAAAPCANTAGVKNVLFHTGAITPDWGITLKSRPVELTDGRVSAGLSAVNGYVDFSRPHIAKNLDNIADGPTYGRPIISRLNGGKPFIDFAEPIHLHQNVDNMGDGATYGRPLISRLNAGKPWIDFSEAIHSNKTIDFIGDGVTYGRPLASRLSGGKPFIDFGEGIHLNKTLDNISDGTTYGSLPLTNISGTGTSKRALIDFTQAHTGKNIDNLADGTTYGRTLSTRLNAGKPVIDFSESIHSNKNLDNIADGATYGSLPLANITGTGATKRALIDFSQGHANKSLANVDSTANTKLTGIATGATANNPRGTWSSASVAYAVNDMVYFNGTLYVCILANTSTATTPANDATHWTKYSPANLDDLSDGTTYGRPIISRLSGGKPFIDFAEPIHLNQNVDNISDGATYARLPVANTTGVGTGRRALIDLANSGHLNVNQDHVGDGGTYVRMPAATTDGSGTTRRALIDFSWSTHANKNLANVDGAANTKLTGIQAGATVGADLSSNVTNVLPQYLPATTAAGGQFLFTGAISAQVDSTGTNATISVGAGTLYCGTSVTYNAMSASVTGSAGTTVTYYLYVTTNIFTGGAHTLNTTTTAHTTVASANIALIGNVTITFTANGGSTGGGAGGGSLGGGGCVTCDTMVVRMDADGNLFVAPASEVVVGDRLRIIDPVTFDERYGLVSRADHEMQPCVRITTENGFVLECSTTAPIAVMGGEMVLAPDLLGELVVYCDRQNDTYGHSRVVAVDDIGDREIVFITCEDSVFLAGQSEGRYLAHHNSKA